MAIICLALILYTCQTKWNLTLLGGVAIVAVLILIVYLFWLPIYSHYNKSVSVTAFLLSIFWIYDNQRMMEGKHSISNKEYVFAALNLNMDMAKFSCIIVLVSKCVLKMYLHISMYVYTITIILTHMFSTNNSTPNTEHISNTTQHV